MDADTIRGWFAGRLPADWFTGTPDVALDRDEILVAGTLPDVEVEEGVFVEAARAGRIKQFREDTRDVRIRIALEAEHRFGRKVSWGAACGDRHETFTSAAVPHMTRLRMAERQVLDTLVDAGIARSRSESLAWCVRLVGQKQSEWLDELRGAMVNVQKVRESGPDV